MIGNDIVDVNKANLESNIFRPRFLEKILTPEEQLKVNSSQQPNQIFWQIWSCKEAVYKAAQRELSFKRFYSPKQFIVQSITENFASVVYSKINYNVDIETHKSFIYSVTSIKINTNSIVVSNKLEALKQLSNVFQSKVSIHKDRQGLPYLKANHKQIKCSVTHHGKFFAVQYEC